MLITERHQKILALLEQKETVTIQELVDELASSESTIRRDLSQLNKEKMLKRVHGGASLLQQKQKELSMSEKETINLEAKEKVARLAASLVKENDCIYLDAGTTTFQMIAHLPSDKLTVVTNGLTHADVLAAKGIDTHLIGGKVKPTTKALVGRKAEDILSGFRFDKSFIGVNGVHSQYGFTTPDIEEAAIKALAAEFSQKVYVLADHSKFQEVTFARIADIEKASIITDETDEEFLAEFSSRTPVLIAR